MQLSVYSVSVSSFKLRHSTPRRYMVVCSQSLSKISHLNLISGRFITGLGVGSLSMAVPLYKYAIAFPFYVFTDTLPAPNFLLLKSVAVWLPCNNLLSPSVF